MPAKFSDARSPTENLGTNVVHQLAPPSAVGHDASADPIKLENYKSQSSYSFVDNAQAPAILVPGAPGIWKASTEFPMTPSKDPSPLYIDEAAHRCPNSPLAPAIVAVKHEQPNFPFSNLDIVVDRAPLLNLLAWASHPDDKEMKDFRIDLELLGSKTVAMTRWEAKVVELACKSTAHKFEEEMVHQIGSTDGFKITGHQRIATFDFLGSSVMLRSDVPACTVAAPTSPKGSEALALSPMEDLGSGLLIHATHTPLVAQSGLVDLSTLSKTAKVDRTEIFNRLFFAQIPSLLLARHAKGAIGAYEDVQLKGMRVEEKKAQEGMRKLAALLEEIKTFMRGQGKQGQYSLVRTKGKSQLEIYERTGGVQVPQGLKGYFE